MWLTVALIAVLALSVLDAVGVYKTLAIQRNRYKSAYTQIDVQLKRRYELIPNLVATIKAHLKRDTDALDILLRARNSAYAASQRAAENSGDPNAMHALADAEAALSAALTHALSLVAVVPELNANQTLCDLRKELTVIEALNAAARQTYNDCVTRYNRARAAIPALLLAVASGFSSAARLDVIDDNANRQHTPALIA
jgi:LemA protein